MVLENFSITEIFPNVFKKLTAQPEDPASKRRCRTARRVDSGKENRIIIETEPNPIGGIGWVFVMIPREQMDLVLPGLKSGNHT